MICAHALSILIVCLKLIHKLKHFFPETHFYQVTIYEERAIKLGYDLVVHELYLIFKNSKAKKKFLLRESTVWLFVATKHIYVLT